MHRVRRTVSAPADLGTDVIAVPAGSDIDLDLRLEAVVEGVLVSGSATATAVGQCVRCLDNLERAVVVDVQQLYAYPGQGPKTPAGVGPAQRALRTPAPCVTTSPSPTSSTSSGPTAA